VFKRLFPIYSTRGQAENLIKLHKAQLALQVKDCIGAGKRVSAVQTPRDTRFLPTEINLQRNV